MKKILFLSYNYPNGAFGASTLCSTRIMSELCKTGEYEVHCISYDTNKEPVYDIIEGVVCHTIPLRLKQQSRWGKLWQVLALPFYPINNLCYDYKHYLACREICKREKFDLVVSQYYSEQNLISGVLLRKNGYIDNLAVVFWDNLYGKLPRRIIPKWWALHRQRIVENIVAKYSDTLISLYPIKEFHDTYGDVPNATGKRFYLGIPSVQSPLPPQDTPYDYVVKKDKINILFSGSIIRKDYIHYIVDVLNEIDRAVDINLIFFSQGMSEVDFNEMQSVFKGTIINHAYIPNRCLQSLYHRVDICLSVTGYSDAIRSKCFEYISYGCPLLLVYGEDKDVNVDTFSKYPNSIAIDSRLSIKENVLRLDKYIECKICKRVEYSTVEEIFRLDTAKAYVELLSKRI